MIIGSLRSLGLTTFLLTIPIGIAAALLATHDPFVSVETFTEWLAVGITSQLTMGLAMLTGYMLCRQLDGQSARFAVILATLFAGAVRGATVAILTDQWALVGTATVPTRILSSTATFALWLLIIGAALHANDRYRAELASLLRELLTSELITRAQTFAVPDQREDDLSARVRAQATAIRDALDTTAATAGSGASAGVLRREIDGRLRPLSHELWRGTDIAADLSTRGEPFLARALRTSPPLVWLGPLLAASFIVNSIVWNGFDPGVLIGVVFSSVYLVILAFGYRGSPTVTPRRSLLTALALLTLPALAVWLVALTGGFPTPNVSLLAMAIGSVLVLAVFVMGRTAIDDRARELMFLRTRIDAQVLDEHVELERYRQRANRTAGFLHNTVQARLTAAVLQLEQAARTGDASRTQGALMQADAALALAIEHPHGELPSDPKRRLDDIVDAWAGIADIHLTQPSAEVNPMALALAADAIEEAVANAVRHGGATAITVEIRNSASELLVTVRDNGSPAEGSGGLGEEWMETLTAGRWNRSVSASGSQLTMRLPLQATTTA